MEKPIPHIFAKIFPEIYLSAVNYILTEMPALHMSGIPEIVVQKALYFTMHAVMYSSDIDADVKLDNAEYPDMQISFLERRDGSAADRLIFEEFRRCRNELTMKKLTSAYVKFIETHYRGYNINK